MKQGVYKLILAFFITASLGIGCGDDSDLGEIIIGNPQNIQVADAPAGTLILAQFEDPSVLINGRPTMRLTTMTELQFDNARVTTPGKYQMVGRAFSTATNFTTNNVTLPTHQITEYRELGVGLRYEIIAPPCSFGQITAVNSCNPSLPLPQVGFGFASIFFQNPLGAPEGGIIPLFRMVGPSGRVEFSTNPFLLQFALERSSTYIFRSTAADRTSGRI